VASDNLQTGGVPPPVIGGELPAVADAPPPPEPTRKDEVFPQLLVMLLSLCFGLFLVDAFMSLADDSLVLLFGTHLLAPVRGMFCLFAMLVALVVYGLMGLTPMIPKRLFLPITLFNPLAVLVAIPLTIYFFSRREQISWVISLCQVAFGLGMLGWIRGGFKLRWPLVPAGSLRARRFSWPNLFAFVLVNVFVVLPAVAGYLAGCAALAVDHFSDGFLALRPAGFTVRVRKYARADGKTIQLVPMAHIGEAEFYRNLSRSFPTNAVVLMEGVTDDSNLLTNRITYKRMASSLGLAEQHEEFHPVRVDIVMADVDVGEFTTNTVGFLNLAMLLHAQGLNAGTILQALRFSPPPHLEEQLIDDLLRKRNQHLLEQIQTQLLQPEPIIVPWGVAHMPGIAEGLRAAGFHVVETHEYTVIGFHPRGSTPE